MVRAGDRMAAVTRARADRGSMDCARPTGATLTGGVPVTVSPALLMGPSCDDARFNVALVVHTIGQVATQSGREAPKNSKFWGFGQRTPMRREHSGHWPQPNLACRTRAASSWTVGVASWGYPENPRFCHVPTLN